MTIYSLRETCCSKNSQVRKGAKRSAPPLKIPSHSTFNLLRKEEVELVKLIGDYNRRVVQGPRPDYYREKESGPLKKRPKGSGSPAKVFDTILRARVISASV